MLLSHKYWLISSKNLRASLVSPSRRLHRPDVTGGWNFVGVGAKDGEKDARLMSD